MIPANHPTSLYIVNCYQRRRINTDEKAKLVAAVWGTEFIQFLAVAEGQFEE